MPAHNNSPNARAAEGRGERTWTGWGLSLLIDEALRCNQRDLTRRDLVRVKCLEYLKVMLLERTERHHVRLRMSAELKNDRVFYYAINAEKARKLTSAEVARWRAHLPAPDELDEMVYNLTDHVFYRGTRR